MYLQSNHNLTYCIVKWEDGYSVESTINVKKAKNKKIQHGKEYQIKYSGADEYKEMIIV